MGLRFDKETNEQKIKELKQQLATRDVADVLTKETKSPERLQEEPEYVEELKKENKQLTEQLAARGVSDVLTKETKSMPMSASPNQSASSNASTAAQNDSENSVSGTPTPARKPISVHSAQSKMDDHQDFLPKIDLMQKLMKSSSFAAYMWCMWHGLAFLTNENDEKPLALLSQYDKYDATERGNWKSWKLKGQCSLAYNAKRMLREKYAQFDETDDWPFDKDTTQITVTFKVIDVKHFQKAVDKAIISQTEYAKYETILRQMELYESIRLEFTRYFGLDQEKDSETSAQAFHKVHQMWKFSAEFKPTTTRRNPTPQRSSTTPPHTPPTAPNRTAQLNQDERYLLGQSMAQRRSGVEGSDARSSATRIRAQNPSRPRPFVVI